MGNYILDSKTSVIEWINSTNAIMDLNFINFSDSNEWFFANEREKLQHKSGKFFSIDGLYCESSFYKSGYIEQAIINQPEIGILGSIVKKIEGQLCFLVQLKAEPGNVSTCQLAPTVQATESNYNKVHGGAPQPYIEHFTDNLVNNRILYDELQSEQGSRFLRKRNRNIVIEVEEEIGISDRKFRWIPLNVIRELLSYDYFINTDFRSVLCCCLMTNMHSIFKEAENIIFDERILNPLKSIMRHPSSGSVKNSEQNSAKKWLEDIRQEFSFNTEIIPLSRLRQWVISKNSISHSKGCFFNIRQIKVNSNIREVKTWDQPIVQSVEQGLCALICQVRRGKLYLLVQARVEPGCYNKAEITCSVQINEDNIESEYVFDQRLLSDWILNTDRSQILVNVYNSEEGGRFYRDKNRYMLVEIDSNVNFSEPLPKNYDWFPLEKIGQLLEENNNITNELRSCLSLIFTKGLSFSN